jgi:DNA-binding ferritin-like protein
MDKVNNLICSLIAIQNFCKDIHYNSKGDAFYSKHLLADRVQENISDYIDRIKEVAILGNDEKTLPSGEYLSRATSLIPELAEDDKENFKSLENLLVNTLMSLQDMEATLGEDNLYGTIAEDLQNSLGLINRQIK